MSKPDKQIKKKNLLRIVEMSDNTEVTVFMESILHFSQYVQHTKYKINHEIITLTVAFFPHSNKQTVLTLLQCCVHAGIHIYQKGKSTTCAD